MERIVMENVPEPDELYGREALLRQINGSLNRNNILLLAPRRFGKTGVMHYLNKRPPGGLFPLAFDLEDAQSGADFVARLVARTTGCQPLRPLVERATKGFCAAGNWLDWSRAGFDHHRFLDPTPTRQGEASTGSETGETDLRFDRPTVSEPCCGKKERLRRFRAAW